MQEFDAQAFRRCSRLYDSLADSPFAKVNEPALILADEPTGQLDSATGASIIALLRQIVAETGVTVIIASHDPKVHEAADVVFELKDGRRVG